MSGDVLGTHFGGFGSNWVSVRFCLKNSPVYSCFSGLFQFFWFFMVFSVFYGFFGFWGEPDGNLGPLAPGEYQPLWPPGPDEGSTTGRLWRGLTGGEVRNMRHISRGRYEP